MTITRNHWRVSRYTNTTSATPTRWDVAAQLLQLSHLRLRLLPEKAVTGAWIGLPLTRIIGLNPDGRIDIDHDLIPPHH
ncbi:type VI secretion protein [Salmonella enterica subsp. enterica]|uniref:Type VI secretion protein n=1 Tax=Salmonella enterica I TaxID=59201 RepID=A0A379WE82_SALET|nr:type VI secretion protein [Salmonella enterica subsp. enterica]